MAALGPIEPSLLLSPNRLLLTPHCYSPLQPPSLSQPHLLNMSLDQPRPSVPSMTPAYIYSFITIHTPVRASLHPTTVPSFLPSFSSLHHSYSASFSAYLSLIPLFYLRPLFPLPPPLCPVLCLAVPLFRINTEQPIFQRCLLKCQGKGGFRSCP